MRTVDSGIIKWLALCAKEVKSSPRTSSFRMTLFVIHTSASIWFKKLSVSYFSYILNPDILIKHSIGLLELSHITRPYLLAPWGFWNTSTNPNEVCSLLLCDPVMAYYFNTPNCLQRQMAESFSGSIVCATPDKTCLWYGLNLNSLPAGLHSTVSTKGKEEILGINAY